MGKGDMGRLVIGTKFDHDEIEERASLLLAASSSSSEL
jgi:hypothetical protein